MVVAAGFLDAEAGQAPQAPHLAKAEPAAALAHIEPTILCKATQAQNAVVGVD